MSEVDKNNFSWLFGKLKGELATDTMQKHYELFFKQGSKQSKLGEVAGLQEKSKCR